MSQYFEILSKMSLVSSSSLFAITVMICLLNIFQNFWTCLCGRVVSKSHLPTVILTCLWTSANKSPAFYPIDRAPSMTVCKYVDRKGSVAMLADKNSNRAVSIHRHYRSGTLKSNTVKSKFHLYRSGMVNSKSFIGKDFLRNKWKYELTMYFKHEMIGK